MRRLALALILAACVPALASAAPTADQYREQISKARADATALRQELARVRKIKTGRSAHEAIAIASALTGTPSAWLWRTGRCESGLSQYPDTARRSDAKVPRGALASPSGFIGPFQYTWSTWRGSWNPVRHLSPNSWYASAIGAAVLYQRDGAGHWPVCGA